MMAVFTTRAALQFAVRLRTRFRQRALEWEHASIAVLLGVVFVSHPELFKGDAYSAPIFQLTGPAIWGWVILTTGALRLIALAINGYMAQPTALIRAISAALGVGLFGVITLGILTSGTVISALAAWIPITVFGLFSISWAIVDVGIPDRHDAAR